MNAEKSLEPPYVVEKSFLMLVFTLSFHSSAENCLGVVFDPLSKFIKDFGWVCELHSVGIRYSCSIVKTNCSC